MAIKIKKFLTQPKPGNHSSALWGMGRFVWLFRIAPSFTATFLFSFFAHAQYDVPENRTWVFGIFAGLDFNSGQPVPIRTEVSGAPGSSAHTGMASVGVSDRNGQLLFYTNGSHVWDRNHNLMWPAPLHSGAMSLTPVTQVTTQGTLVVPIPGDPDKYYIFSLTHPGYHAPVSVTSYGKLYYSVVDMQLNGGNGGIVPGQYWQLMGEDLCDKMIAVAGDNCNVWLVVHAMEANRFLAYEINPSGISNTPVISNVGSTGSLPAAGGRNQYWVNGQMSVSHDHKKLAICATMGMFTELFDFSTATGSVSNPVMLDTGFAAFGLVFSPDNTKLYQLSQDMSSAMYWHIFQYDMTAGSPVAIRQSKTKVSTGLLPRSQLKLGPDKRIYFGNSRDMYGNPTERGRLLGTILSPDVLGTACGFVPRAVELLDSTSMIYGLSHEVTPIRDSVFSKRIVRRCLESEMLEAPPGYESYLWNNGTQGNSIMISADGLYWVSGKIGCVTYVDTFEVRTAVFVSLGNDTVVCNNPRPITLRPDTDNPITEYRWSDSSAGRTLVVRNSGIYWVKVTAANGCVASDTIDITLTHLAPDLGNDTIYCGIAEAPVTLSVTPPSMASVLWSSGSERHAIQIRESGTYWVQFREGICEASDTVNVTFTDIRQYLGPDLLLCRELPVAVELNTRPLPDGSTSLWSDGSTSDVFTARDTGMYWVEVRHAQCVESDTVYIRSELCDCPVSFPTAFTPNGDGLNDVFRPVIGSECLISNLAMVVYNRWGETVFSTQNLSFGWDGTFKGVPAESGVYMYRTMVVVGTERHVKEFKGDITLIR